MSPPDPKLNRLRSSLMKCSTRQATSACVGGRACGAVRAAALAAPTSIPPCPPSWEPAAQERASHAPVQAPRWPAQSAVAPPGRRPPCPAAGSPPTAARPPCSSAARQHGPACTLQRAAVVERGGPVYGRAGGMRRGRRVCASVSACVHACMHARTAASLLAPPLSDTRGLAQVLPPPPRARPEPALTTW